VETTGWESREGGEGWYVASRYLQGCSPCLYRLRTDRMLVLMSLVSLVVGHRQELALHPLLHWLAQERNWVQTCGSLNRCAVDCVGSSFSQEQWDPSKSVGVS
jgi:hypothetical protein